MTKLSLSLRWILTAIAIAILPSTAFANNDVSSGYQGAYGAAPTGACVFCHQTLSGGQPTSSHPQYGQDLHGRLNTLYGTYTGSTDPALPRNNTTNLRTVIEQIDNFLASPYAPRLLSVNGSAASTAGKTSLNIAPIVGSNTFPVVFDGGRRNTGGVASVTSLNSSSSLSESTSTLVSNTTTVSVTLDNAFVRNRSANRTQTFDIDFTPVNSSNFRPLASNLIARNVIEMGFSNLDPIGASETMTENNTTRDGTDWVLDVLGNDDDPDTIISAGKTTSVPPTLSCISSDPIGSLVANSDNSALIFTPPSPLLTTSQTVNFQYCPVDNEGAQGDVVSSTIIVPALSSADSPTGVPDEFTATEDVSFSGDVSSNDTSTPAGGELSFSLVTDADKGSVSMSNDGSFTYLGDQDFNGSDSFTYQVANVAGSVLVMVEMTVEPVNDAPVVVSAAIEEVNDLVTEYPNDEPINLVATKYVTDVDTDTLTASNVRISSINESFRSPSDIVYDPDDLFAISGNGLTIFPSILKNIDDGDYAEISFTYDVSDGQETVTPSFTIRITGVDNDLGRTPGSYADSISERYNNHFKGFADSGNGACLTCHNPGQVLIDIDFRSDCTADVFNAYGLALCLDPSVDIGDENNLVARMINAETLFAPSVKVPSTALQIGETAQVGDAVGAPLSAAKTGQTIDGLKAEIVQYLFSRGPNEAPTNVDPSGNFEISSSGQVSIAAGADLEPGSYPLFVLPVNDAGQKNAGGDILDGLPGFYPTQQLAAITVFVGALPTEPVEDTVSTFVGQGVTVDVLANDGGGAASTVTVVSGPVNGAVTINADLSIGYTPNTGFIGTDSFDYTSQNMAGAADTQAKVTVSVLIEGALLAVDDTVRASANRETRIDVLANDINVVRDGTNATVVSLTSGLDPATEGSLTVDGQTIVFTSTVGAQDSLSFTYSATNPNVAGDNGSTGTVSLNIAELGGTAISDAAISPELQKVARSFEQSCQIVQDSGALDADAQAFLDVCIDLTLASDDAETVAEAMKALRNEENLAVVDATSTVARSLGRVLNRRLTQIRDGAARGFDASGVNLSIDGETLPTELVTKMAGGYLGLNEKQTTAPDWGLFVAGDFSWAQRDGSDTSADYDMQSNNLMLGYDVVLDPNTTVGMALGYSRSETDFSGGGTLDAEGFQVTAYGVKKDFYKTDLTLDGYISVGRMNFISNRAIQFTAGASTVDEVATADFNGTYINVAPRLSYSKVLGNEFDPLGALRTGTRLTWSASLDYLWLGVDGYTETGGGGFALNVNPETYESLLLSLGIDASRPIYLAPNVTSEIYGGLLVQGELLDKDRSLSAAFAAAGPGAPRFLVSEDGVQGLGAHLNVGMRLRTNQNSHFDINYSYGMSKGGVTSQSASFSYSFEVLGNDSMAFGATRTAKDLSVDLSYDLRF